VNIDAVSSGDGSSHAVEFERMDRCKFCAIQNGRKEAVSYDRAMRKATENLAAFAGSLVKHEVPNCSGAKEPFRGSRIEFRLTIGVPPG
jgi:hypothetical protein